MKFNNGKRKIKSQFIGMTSYNPNHYMWDFDELKWIMLKDVNNNHSYANCCPCHSVRAFRRRLSKAPNGVEFVLVNRYKGYRVIGYGRR